MVTTRDERVMTTALQSKKRVIERRILKGFIKYLKRRCDMDQVRLQETRKRNKLQPQEWIMTNILKHFHVCFLSFPCSHESSSISAPHYATQYDRDVLYMSPESSSIASQSRYSTSVTPYVSRRELTSTPKARTASSKHGKCLPKKNCRISGFIAASLLLLPHTRWRGNSDPTRTDRLLWSS